MPLSRIQQDPLRLLVSHRDPESYVAGRRIELLVPAEEIGRRMAAFSPAPPHYARGYGRLFVEHVTQANRGCDFDFLGA